MKHLLTKHISQEQSMFVENRSIRDNILLASEILRHMKCNLGKSGGGGIKGTHQQSL